MTTNLNFTFGTSPDFSFVPTVGPGLRWYPVRFISLYSQGRLGTLTFSSYTLMANVGIDVNIPVGESAVLVVGAEGEFNWSSQHLDDEVLRCRNGDGEGQTGRVDLRCVRLAGRR